VVAAATRDEALFTAAGGVTVPAAMALLTAAKRAPIKAGVAWAAAFQPPTGTIPAAVRAAMALSKEVLSNPSSAASLTATSPWVWAMAGPEVRIKAPATKMKTIKTTQAYLFAFIVHLLSAAEVLSKVISPLPLETVS
jgi:hypothetical protein